MANTSYAQELAHVADANGHRIERLLIKAHGTEEIRFSWWPNGRFSTRPLDLSEAELLPLIQAAIAQGVFTPAFLSSLKAILP